MSHHSGTESDQKNLTKTQNEAVANPSHVYNVTNVYNTEGGNFGDIQHKDFRKSITALKVAANGSTIMATEDSTRSTLAVQAPSGDTSAQAVANDSNVHNVTSNTYMIALGNIDIRKNLTAQQAAVDGGIITTTEHGGTHTLAVQTPSGNTSAEGTSSGAIGASPKQMKEELSSTSGATAARPKQTLGEESPLTSGANGARPDRTSENDSSSFLNGVWMQKDSARIESVFFKDTDALKLGNDMFLNNHKSLSWPGQIFASEGDTVQLKIGFKQPPDMQIEPVKERLEITKRFLGRIWRPTYFMPNPGPDNLQLGQLCKASYEAEVFTCEGKTTSGGFSDELHFSWPLTSNQGDKNDERRARPGNDCQQIIGPNLRASGNANTGRCDEHIDQSRKDVASRHRYDGEASSEQYKNYFSDTVNTLEQTSNQKDFKVHIVGVDGGTPELGGCKIDVQPGLVENPTEIEICLGNDPNHSPDSVVPVSHIFKCKPSKFKAPVHVKLISYLVPKPGKQLRIKIMSKTGGADWKQILEVILGHGNVIEYSVEHFCWHVAVVSEEDEKDGEYHLFNDVWMHIPTGMMLSLFWKDWFSLTKGSKKLEVDHKRIISLPVEVIASVGDTVAADIECLGYPEMKITSVDGSAGRIEIGSAMRKKKFFAMLFRPDPHLESLKATNRFEVIYRANVINGEGQRTDGGFSVPLHVTPSLLRSIGCSAVPTEQERNDDQPSISYQPDAVKQTVTHAAEASGLNMIGPIEVALNSEEEDDDQSNEPCRSGVREQTLSYVTLSDDNSTRPDKTEPSTGTAFAAIRTRSKQVEEAVFHKGGGYMRFIKPKIYLAGGNIGDSDNKFRGSTLNNFLADKDEPSQDGSQQSGLVDMIVTEDNPIIIRRQMQQSDLVPAQQTPDFTEMMSEFQENDPNNRSNLRQQQVEKLSLKRSAAEKTLTQQSVSKKVKVPSKEGIVIFDEKSKHLQLFNPADNTLTQRQSFNEDMKPSRFTAVTLHDFVYVLMENKSVLRLEYSDNRAIWEPMSAMIDEHGLCPPATVMSGCIYVAGAGAGGNWTTVSYAMEKFDPSTKKWSSLKEKEKGTTNNELVVAQGCIYSIGGFSNARAPLKEVERFDPVSSTATWAFVAPMKQARCVSAAVEFSGKIFVLGGSNGGEFLSSVEIYDPSTDMWSAMNNNMLTPRAVFSAFVINGDIYAVGGDKEWKSIERYSFERDVWEEVQIQTKRKINICASTKIQI